MPTTASRVRKGTFSLKTKDDAQPVVFSCSPTAITLTPEAGDTGDSLEVLCGDNITGEAGATKWTLNFVSIQQIETTNTDQDSLVLYSLKNDGQQAEFEFKPGPTTKTFTGTAQVVSIAIGGEVGGTAPTSEAEWPMSGPPTVKATPPGAAAKAGD
ncbi:hypothetical protein [Streptomyces alboflavus]|uniref:hypothetical protein n=1 Tax=Streptomyces alboflavus TaxID=67267 RepID=UPI003674D6E0